MKNVIQKVNKLNGAAPVLGAKIIGRIIDQVARGFTEDEQLGDLMAVYKGLLATHPDTVSMRAMWESMHKRAVARENANGFKSEFDKLSPEQQSVWEDENQASEREALEHAVPLLSKLFIETEANIERWDDLPTIAQWSLLNRMEGDLPNKISLYTGWTMGTGDTTKAQRLLANVQNDVQPVYELITQFLNNKTVNNELCDLAEQGINVRPRMIA